MKAIKAEGNKSRGCYTPGKQYQSVDVTIQRTRRGKWSVEILQTWGQNEGYLEENGRKKVIGRGDDLAAAVANARERADTAGIDPEYMIEALSKAEEEAEEEMEALEENGSLSDVSTDDLMAEIARRNS